MKFLKKTLSVGLSLVLCASMVAPGFAASFSELNDAISSSENKLFGENQDIYASTGDDGVRNVELRGDVTYAGENDDTTISVSKDVTIDLNGQTIDGGYRAADEEKGDEGNAGSGKSVITVKGGADLTIKDSTAEWTTTTDAEGNEIKTYESGQITGGNADGLYHENKVGGGVNVADGNLTLESGTITGNNAKDNGGGVYVSGDGTFTMNDGVISENNGGNMGGGVYVNTITSVQNGNQAQFIMNGGEISNNEATAGGGIGSYGRVEDNNKDGYVAVDINGGKITGNTAKVSHGGGIYVQHDHMEISGAEISQNTAAGDAGGIYIYQSNVNITGTIITRNTAKGNQGGGMSVHVGSNVTVDSNSKIYSNHAGTRADDVYKQAGATLYLPSAVQMTIDGKPIVGEDGKPITGWFFDANGRWGKDGTNPYASQNNPATAGDRYTNNNLYLKAAHGEYFDVVYTDGADGALFADQEYEVENKNPIPVFNGDIPERPGYTFAGWLVDGESFDPETGTVTGTLTLVADWTPNPTPVEPDDPGIEVEDPDVPLGDEPEVEITDPAIPLAAGPVTRAQFVDYLWRHEGEPAPVQDDGLFEDVTVEHEYSPAMAWAKSIGIIEAYEDGTFEPDELVTVAAVRSILTRFAAYADMTMPELTTLTGGDDEAVLNCDQVLAEFFGEEYTSPDADVEVDTAA